MPSEVAAPKTPEELTKSPEILLTPQQLQEQHQQLLKAVDLIRQDAEVGLQRYTATVDLLRQDTEVSLRRYASAVDGKLDLLSQAVTFARERELETLRRSNRLALTIASVIVGILLLEVLFLTWISARAVNRLTIRLSAWVSEHNAFPGYAAELAATADPLLSGKMFEEANQRLENAIERFERRLLEMEHTAGRFPTAAARPPASQISKTSDAPSGFKPLPAKPTNPSRVSLSLGEGESLIFLPRSRRLTQFPSYRAFLRKLWKRFQLAWFARGH